MITKRKAIKIGPLFTIGLPTLYTIILFVIPILVFFIYSFWQLKGYNIVREWTLKNYIEVATNSAYTVFIIRSIVVGMITAIVTVVLGYPLAYAMTFRMREGREFVLLLMVLSLFSSYLVRVYAWKSILGSNGLINVILIGLGIVEEPVSWLIYSRFAVVTTLTSVFLPIAVLPMYSVMMNIHPNLLEASRDMGANPVQTFWKVTLPLSMPGVVAGFVFTFVLTAGDYITPQLLGGSAGQLIGNSIVSQFGVLSNWPLGAAITFYVVGLFFVMFLIGSFITSKLGLRR